MKKLEDVLLDIRQRLDEIEARLPVDKKLSVLNTSHGANINVSRRIPISGSQFFIDFTGDATLRNVSSLYNRTMLEPTGFVDRASNSLSFNPSTRVLTIAPTSTSFKLYLANIEHEKTTETVTLSTQTGLHYIYYSASGVLTESMSAWDLLSGIAPVALAYYNGSGWRVMDERHGCNMDSATHDYLHNSIGTRYASGLSGSFNNTGFSITSGIIYDEDIRHSISNTSQCAVIYRSSGLFAWTSLQNAYYYSSGGNVYYDNAGTIQAAPANQYVAYYILATNDLDSPIISLMGQRTDVTLADAIANNVFTSLNLGDLPYKEFKHIYTVIVRNDATPYEQAIDHRFDVSLGTSTVSTDHALLTNLNSTNYRHITQTEYSGVITNSNITQIAGITPSSGHGLFYNGSTWVSRALQSSDLPAIAITDTFVVASQSAMLALTAQTGDVAVRSDLNKSFILKGTDPTQLSEWQELLTPTDSVLSVDGRTGVVTLSDLYASLSHNHNGTYQALSSILSSIAGLSTSNTGLVKLTNGTASLDSSAYTYSSGSTGYIPYFASSLQLSNSKIYNGTYGVGIDTTTDINWALTVGGSAHIRGELQLQSNPSLPKYSFLLYGGTDFALYNSTNSKLIWSHDNTNNLFNFNTAIRSGSFLNGVVNSLEAKIGRASDENTGSLTFQLGGSSDNTWFRLVDRAWSRTIFSVHSAATHASLQVNAHSAVGIGTDIDVTTNPNYSHLHIGKSAWIMGHRTIGNQAVWLGANLFYDNNGTWKSIDGGSSVGGLLSINYNGEFALYNSTYNSGTGNLDLTARVTMTASGINVNGNTVWHSGNDGSGSGLDADTLDGYHGSNYLGKNGNTHYQADNWIQFSGLQGMYNPNSGSGTEVVPVNPSYYSYGSYGLIGSRNSWAGLLLVDSYCKATFMSVTHTSNVTGVYQQSNNRWQWFHDGTDLYIYRPNVDENGFKAWHQGNLSIGTLTTNYHLKYNGSSIVNSLIADNGSVIDFAPSGGSGIRISGDSTVNNNINTINSGNLNLSAGGTTIGLETDSVYIQVGSNGLCTLVGSLEVDVDLNVPYGNVAVSGYTDTQELCVGSYNSTLHVNDTASNVAISVADENNAQVRVNQRTYTTGTFTFSAAREGQILFVHNSYVSGVTQYAARIALYSGNLGNYVEVAVGETLMLVCLKVNGSDIFWQAWKSAGIQNNV